MPSTIRPSRRSVSSSPKLDTNTMDRKDPLYMVIPSPELKLWSTSNLTSIPELEELELAPEATQAKEQSPMSAFQAMRDELLAPIGLSFAVPSTPKNSFDKPTASKVSATSPVDQAKDGAQAKPRTDEDGEARSAGYYTVPPCGRSMSIVDEQHVRLIGMYRRDMAREDDATRRSMAAAMKAMTPKETCLKKGAGEKETTKEGTVDTSEVQAKQKQGKQDVSVEEEKKGVTKKEGKRKRLMKFLRFWSKSSR